LIGILSGNIGDAELWRAFAFFILTSVLLGWVFVAIAYIASVVAGEKSRAAGVALLVWFWFVLVFDLLLLGGLVASKGTHGGDWLPYLLLLNPTDVFRLANLAGFEAARNYTGLAAVATGPLFQPGVLAGILALWVHSIADLVKLYAERLEAIDQGPIEAITATGAGRLSVLRYAIVPQIVNPYISFTLYRWDINIRMATVVGLVGGGGIGQRLINYIWGVQYRQAGTVMILIVILVWAIDYLSARLRAKLA